MDKKQSVRGALNVAGAVVGSVGSTLMAVGLHPIVWDSTLLSHPSIHRVHLW